MELPRGVTAMAGVDVDWVASRPFAAMHQLHEICAPMGADELGTVIEALAPTKSCTVLDLACGYGPVARAAARVGAEVTAIDLSPWMVCGGHARPGGDLVTWQVGDAALTDPAPAWDRTVCIGASWIWHGFEGTLRALLNRTVPGGLLAIGDLRAKEAMEVAVVDRNAQLEAMIRLGCVPVAEVVSCDQSWEDYGDLLRRSATQAEDEAALDLRSLARTWSDRYAADRQILEFVTWVVAT